MILTEGKEDVKQISPLPFEIPRGVGARRIFFRICAGMGVCWFSSVSVHTG